MKRRAQKKLGLPSNIIEDALHEWRKRVWAQDFKNVMFGPSGILTDEILTALSSVGPILSLKELELIVGENWPWFGKYGDNLLTELISLNIPPIIPKPPKRTKRNATNMTNDRQGGGGGKRQRPLPDNQATTPTPVNIVNTPSTIPRVPRLPSFPFYPYPPTPVLHPPPFSATPIYHNHNFGSYYMTPAPHPMSYYTPGLGPSATPTNIRQTSQPMSFEFQHY